MFSTLSFSKLKVKFHSLPLKRRFWRQAQNLHIPKFEKWAKFAFVIIFFHFLQKSSFIPLFYISLTIYFNCFEQCTVIICCGYSICKPSISSWFTLLWFYEYLDLFLRSFFNFAFSLGHITGEIYKTIISLSAIFFHQYLCNQMIFNRVSQFFISRGIIHLIIKFLRHITFIMIKNLWKEYVMSLKYFSTVFSNRHTY